MTGPDTNDRQRLFPHPLLSDIAIPLAPPPTPPAPAAPPAPPAVEAAAVDDRRANQPPPPVFNLLSRAFTLPTFPSPSASSSSSSSSSHPYRRPSPPAGPSAPLLAVVDHPGLACQSASWPPQGRLELTFRWPALPPSGATTSGAGGRASSGRDQSTLPAAAAAAAEITEATTRWSSPRPGRRLYAPSRPLAQRPPAVHVPTSASSHELNSWEQGHALLIVSRPAQDGPVTLADVLRTIAELCVSSSSPHFRGDQSGDLQTLTPFSLSSWFPERRRS